MRSTSLLTLPFLFLTFLCHTPFVRSDVVSKPSLPPEEEGLSCGQEDTQVTICFPGSRYEAQCEYAVTNSTSISGDAKPCPTATIFGGNCKSLKGLLAVAFGPCQDQITLQSTAVAFSGPQSPAEAPQASDTRPIPDWLNILGFQELTQIGGFVVRGYAYQAGPLPSTSGIDLLPNLQKVGTVVPLSPVNLRLAPLTILGAAVPQLDYVTDLEGGMLLENTPNTNFSSIFGSLETLKGSVIIVGNSQLSSLDGLQGLSTSNVLGHLEILSNNKLSDITALETVFQCVDGMTGIDPPSAAIGVIEVLPDNPSTPSSRCLLTTAAQVCSFIAKPVCSEDMQSSISRFQNFTTDATP